MKIRLLTLLFMVGAIFVVSAQDDSFDRTDLGVSVQLYPAGIIPTVNVERFLNENSSLVFRLGLNIVDRQDFSDFNDTEEGTGFGGSVGYRKHFPAGKGKFIGGLNLDVWSLSIDWTDLNGSGTSVVGSTYTLVVQPWLEGGYFLPIRNSRSQLGLTLGFGREINAITSGDEVEQGFIGSVSLQYLVQL